MITIIRREKTKKSEAFSLMEVMIAMVIIGILATFAIPGALKMLEKVRVNQAKGMMATISSGLVDYKEDMGHFPTRQEGGIEALVIRPNTPNQAKWDGSYIPGKDEIPLDPWNNPYEINFGTQIEKKNLYRYFEVICTGDKGPDDESDNFHTGT